MTATAGKGRSGEVYRYYACRNRPRKTGDRCEHPRLSAPEVEELVISRASHLLADRIGAIEAELEPVHARIAQLDAQMQALQRAAEQVTQTTRILEVFDEAWAAFNAAERQELVLILVEKVVVNEPAGKLDIVFHDLGGPFDAGMSGTTETLTFRSKRQQRTETLALRRAHDERMDRAARRRQQLAHRIAEEIDAGRYADQADVARHHGLTRARLTQLMNLLLAPDIQEEVLALEYPAGREPITERTLRRLLESLV